MNNHFPGPLINRRKFVTSSFAAASSLMFSSSAVFGRLIDSKDKLTVQQLIDLIIKNIPRSSLHQTVDTIKIGSANNTVSGVVTTMFATVDVIQKAIKLKADFIIAHEPTFYNHLDETNWLEQDKVFQYKRELCDKNKITIWRFHDYIHALKPDGIRMGVMESLGWMKYYNEENPAIVNIPTTSLKQLIDHFKASLGISHVKLVGELDQPCTRIGILPGAIGGKAQISFMQREQPDVLVVGEIQEWETSEYLRDARSMGAKQSLIILGHAVSEEPGMKWLVQWLKGKIEGLNVHHVPSEDPFLWV